MEKESPIVIIDDDEEDLQLITEAFNELEVSNELVCFKGAREALTFLKTSSQQPVFILCDVNMNSLSGFEFRAILDGDESLRIKSIPFLFLSTSGHRKDIANAYSLSAQGYFRKPNTYVGIVSMLKCIIEYWGYCQHPNSKGLRDDQLYSS